MCPEPWEVIVSDNGSTDETRRIVERFHGRLPGLRIVAKGEALLFCDADDEVGPGWLAVCAFYPYNHETKAGVAIRDQHFSTNGGIVIGTIHGLA